MRGSTLPLMRYALVVLVSISVGVLVYVLTLRFGQAEPVAVGFEPEPFTPPGRSQTSEPPQPRVVNYRYLMVEVDGRTWRDRLQGLIGSVALVLLGAALVAGTLYTAGAAINRLIRSFLGG